jgi:transcriptional regulator with XRE-family HTH domain
MKTNGGDCPMQNKIVADRLGSVIKTARLENTITQLQLAERLNITPRYLKAIENSGRKPSYDLLVRIVRELGIAADDVFYPEDSQQTAKIYKLWIAK